MRTGKVRTSDSEATTGIGAIPDDAAAKVMPPRETSTRNPHEEVVSSGSMMMASPVVKPAVSSNAKVRSVGTVGVRSRVASRSRALLPLPQQWGMRSAAASLWTVFQNAESFAMFSSRNLQSIRPRKPSGWQPLLPHQRQVRQ